MPAHFYLQDIDADTAAGDVLHLDSERSHYLVRVMRLRQGQAFDAFDGAGLRLQCTLQVASPKTAVVEVKTLAREKPPEHRINLALAVLKGAAMDRAIQLATEFGASEIDLVFARNSNVSLSGKRLEAKHAHWQKIVISAAEQCGRAYLPALRVNHGWQTEQAVMPTLVLEQGAERLSAEDVRRDIQFLVGPEGGWHAEESRQFQQQNLETRRVGETTLRAETVPAAVLTLVSYLQTLS